MPKDWIAFDWDRDGDELAPWSEEYKDEQLRLIRERRQRAEIAEEKTDTREYTDEYVYLVDGSKPLVYDKTQHVRYILLNWMSTGQKFTLDQLVFAIAHRLGLSIVTPIEPPELDFLVDAVSEIGVRIRFEDGSVKAYGFWCLRNLASKELDILSDSAPPRGEMKLFSL